MTIEINAPKGVKFITVTEVPAGVAFLDHANDPMIRVVVDNDPAPHAVDSKGRLWSYDEDDPAIVSVSVSVSAIADADADEILRGEALKSLTVGDRVTVVECAYPDVNDGSAGRTMEVTAIMEEVYEYGPNVSVGVPYGDRALRDGTTYSRASAIKRVS